MKMEEGKRKMETFFITHGTLRSPLNDSAEINKFLKTWKNEVYERRPKAILAISAHWDTDTPTITSADHHDCSFHHEPGLDPLLYKLSYKTRGSSGLAARVKELLTNAGFDGVGLDETKMIDCGAWPPLMMMYPDGEVPVSQLSIQLKESAIHHFNVGKALAPLLEEGVLLLGFGTAVHNPGRIILQGDEPPPTWALEFNNWLTDALLNGRYDDVNEYEKKAPYVKDAHPVPDHLLPLHVAMGAAIAASTTPEDVKTELIHHSWYYVNLSFACFKFTPNPIQE